MNGTAQAQAPAPSDLHVLVTRPDSPATIPGWIRPYSPEKIAGSRVGSLRRLPDLTVVQAKGPGAVLRRHGFLQSLAGKHAKSPAPSKVLFVFQTSGSAPDAGKLAELLRFFSRPGDVEFARGAEQAAFAMMEVSAKISVSRQRAAHEAAAADPLGELSSVVAASAELRADSGRLSARKVAELFGLSVAELARLLDKSRQTVSKTDDAEGLQEGLAPFARIGRLRAVLSPKDFRAWLALANDQLEGRTPLALVREGRAEVVADLAEDMLSGSPG